MVVILFVVVKNNNNINIVIVKPRSSSIYLMHVYLFYLSHNYNLSFNLIYLHLEGSMGKR